MTEPQLPLLAQLLTAPAGEHSSNPPPTIRLTALGHVHMWDSSSNCEHHCLSLHLMSQQAFYAMTMASSALRLALVALACSLFSVANPRLAAYLHGWGANLEAATTAFLTACIHNHTM